MKIKEKMHDKVAVLTVSGKMMGPEAQKLHVHVKGLVADGILSIVIDLSKVNLLNSMGLGALMASWGTVTKKGGVLRLAGITKKIESLLMITKLITFFEHFETVDRAVASY